MSSLKEKLAQKIKKAAQQRKRQLELNNERSLKLSTSNMEREQSQQGEVESLFSQLNIYPNSCIFPNKKEEDGNRDQLIEVYSLKEQEIYMDPFIVQTQKQPEKEEDMEKDISIMIAQKQSRHKEEQEEKKRQLILNAIKNKKRPRPPRPMDKPTPFNQLSPPYQQIKIFASYLPIYEQRRRRQHYSTIVDLGVKNLPEVILQCFLQGIITKNFMKQTKNGGVELEIDFVRKFAENKLDLFDFNACKFTPLDHRWLCARLMKLPEGRGEKYILGERPYCVFKQISDFYEIIYNMEQQRYQYLCEAIRIKYKLHWRESAFHNYRPALNEQEINKFDTSSIYKLKPSPLFGADLQNDQKQFFKAKRELYPDKVKNIVKQAKSQTSKSSEMGSRSDLSDSDSYDSSDDDLSLENQLDDDVQSDMVPQSGYKSSSFTIRKASKMKKKQSESNSSFSQRRKQSDEESEGIYDEDQVSNQYTDSMFGSKSQSVSKREKDSQISKNQIKKRKMETKVKERKIRESKDSINSNEQDRDVFDD